MPGLAGDRAVTQCRLDQRLVQVPAAGKQLADPARQAQNEEQGTDQ